MLINTNVVCIYGSVQNRYVHVVRYHAMSVYSFQCVFIFSVYKIINTFGNKFVIPENMSGLLNLLITL